MRGGAEGAIVVPIELSSVAETLAEGDGFWRSCSGCHETNEGHETGHYPYSKILKCHLGGGCSECGGIGAVWDDTDYEAMGRDFERSLVAPSRSPAMAAEDKADAERYRWLCDGNGYFMEENVLCGHSNQKAEADVAIDRARGV